MPLLPPVISAIFPSNFAIPASCASGVKGFGATPQRAWVEPVRVAIEHPAKEIERGGIGPQQLNYVVEVFARLGDRARAVVIEDPVLVAGDDPAWVQGFN